MPDQNFKLFREKPLEAVDSTDNLNDYLHVTSPGIWLVLGVVILLLAGAVVWGCFGHIDTTVQAAVVTEAGESTCYVPAEAMQSVLNGAAVTVDGQEWTFDLSGAEPQPMLITAESGLYLLLAGGYTEGDAVYPIPVFPALPTEDESSAAAAEDSIASGTIITERLTPIRLLLN